MQYKSYLKFKSQQLEFITMIKDDPRIDEIKATTQIYQDFPKKGVNFLDIFPIVADSRILGLVTDIFAQRLEKEKIQFDKIFMLESRGFLFAVPLSQKTGMPCYPIRKKGKLPGECLGIGYGLEYGKDQIQVQKSSVKKGDRVVLIDDVLATGGTMGASIQLMRQAGAEIVQILLLNRVEALHGQKKLPIEEEKIFYIYDI